MKRLFKEQKGFTLIELLIVIVILGVLAAAIIPNLTRFLNAGTVGAANAELASVRTGIAAYQTENDGDLPTDGSGNVNNDLIVGYITGSSGIKCAYDVDEVAGSATYSLITGGDATGTDWEDKISWDADLDKWEKYVAP